VKGQAWLRREAWAWPNRAQLPGIRAVRLTACRPPSGPVTLVMVEPPGRDRDDRRCQEPSLRAPRVIRAWRRRRWMEPPFRLRTPLRAPEACQVPGAEADDGHLGLRRLAGIVRLEAARSVCRAPGTMAESLCSLTHDWRVLGSDLLEGSALSWGLGGEAA